MILKTNQTQRHNSSIIEDLYQQVQQLWTYQTQEYQVESIIVNSMDCIVQQARAKNPKACFLLARSYHLGHKLLKDPNSAKFWFRVARELGEKHCIYNLYIIEKDEKLKAELLEQGVKLQEMRCMHEMSQRYIKDDGPDQAKKYSLGIKIMQNLMKSNYPSANFLAWLAYTKPNSQKYDMQKAKQHLKMWAQKKFKDCNWPFIYGQQLYKSGHFKQALQQLYAAQKTCSNTQKGEIQCLIGQCYDELKDTQNAKQWYKRAMSRKYLAAFSFLAVLYDNEGETELEKQTLMKGIKLQNNSDNDLARMYYYIASRFQQQEVFQDAYRYHYQAVKLGDEDSQTCCGEMLSEGSGVKEDFLKGGHLTISALSKARQKDNQTMNPLSQSQLCPEYNTLFWLISMLKSQKIK